MTNDTLQANGTQSKKDMPISGEARTEANTKSSVVLAPGETLRMETVGLSVRYGEGTYGIRDVSMSIADKRVTALIGPSGCGKSTFLRSLNRMHDLSTNVLVTGKAYLDGEDLYAPEMDAVLVRRRIGMVFQKPTPFPTKSIYENVCAGLRLVGIRNKAVLDEAVERSLRRAALWDEVKDRLRTPGGSISGGQQQRLCIARALAVEPEVILMDEPTSSLDPNATTRIEQLIHELKEWVTIVIVTHNMHQAARVSDYTGFFFLGEIVELSSTKEMFLKPRQKKTEEYLTGFFS